MKTPIEKQKLDLLVEGIIFSYTKKCPFLTEADINNLKEIVEGYLKDGVKHDRSFIEWKNSKEWV